MHSPFTDTEYTTWFTHFHKLSTFCYNIVELKKQGPKEVV